LDSNGSFNLLQVGLGQATDLLAESALAYCGQLISHRLSRLPLEGYMSLARVQALHVARQWNDLDAVEEPVGGVVADNDGGAAFLDLAAD
jgi:hypothetical protein